MTYLGHNDGVQGELSAAENLRAVACLNGAKRGAIGAALTQLGLGALGSLPAKYFSQGQRRRLALSRLLLLRRPLWILDEPFTALDAASCRLLERLLREHLATGGLIVLSSHQAFAFPEATTQQLDLDAIREGRRDATTSSVALAGAP
jgi:heme exporter protein A